jgi:SAM-dependent methyltransferase
MDLKTIDWNALWQQETKNSPFQKRVSSKDLWNKQAASFNKGMHRVRQDAEGRDKDDYISKMLERIETKPEWTVLDIGCGPGTLTIPLAKKVKSVTALDISSEMLKHLKANSDKAGLNNVVPLNSSWEDALSNNLAGFHDIVVASRSVTPVNLKVTLSQIAAFANQAAYLTFPVVHLPFDWEVYQVIGRGQKRHPSYIYIYNTLYQMGIQANVEILFCRVRTQYANVEEAISDLQWRTSPFSAEEQAKLRNYLEEKFAEQKINPVLLMRVILNGL